MTLVKKFNDFVKPKVSQDVNEADITPVSKGTPEKGEVARWDIVIKDRKEGAVDVANPSQTYIELLARDPEFKTWWNESDPGKQYKSPNAQTIPNHNMLAVIDLGVSNKTNLFGKKVFKASIAFLPYSDKNTGTGTQDVMYDVTKVKHRALSEVSGSGVKLAAWNRTDLPAIKLPSPIPAKDKAGKLVDRNLVSPAYMEEAGGAPTAVAATTATTDTTTDTKTNTDTKTTTDTASASTGLKATQNFDQKIQDLQKKIIASGNAEAAKAITDKGGAIGKYGSGTAKAIGILTGTNKEEREITPELAAKLDAALKNVTPEQIAAVKAPAAQAATTVKPAEKVAAITVTTKKGILTF
jgi:hypothetical protein